MEQAFDYKGNAAVMAAKIPAAGVTYLEAQEILRGLGITGRRAMPEVIRWAGAHGVIRWEGTRIFAVAA